MTKETIHSIKIKHTQLKLCQSTVCCYWFHNPDNLHWFALFCPVQSGTQYEKVQLTKTTAMLMYLSREDSLSLQHLPPHRTEAFPGPWMKAWEHVTASCSTPSPCDSLCWCVWWRDHNSLKFLTRPPLFRALAQISLFLPGILSYQLKKPDAMSGSVLLPASPHTQDSKTRTTRWILQFYIYNWTFIIFKISTRFITINYTLLSKYIKR